MFKYKVIYLVSVVVKHFSIQTKIMLSKIPLARMTIGKISWVYPSDV